MNLKKEFTQHSIFSDLSHYIKFYDGLSFSVMSFMTQGTTAMANIDTYVLSSIQSTLESIKMILEDGKLNDAYALLRKYHDSIIINIYSTLYLQNNHTLESFIVEKINDWLHGKEKLPSYNEMKQYIEKDHKLANIKSVFDTDKRYTTIRERCNDHMHYNFFHYMMINDKRMYDDKRIVILDTLKRDIKDLFVLHFGYLFTLNDIYFMSSDYIDELECGASPKEEMLYWVAPPIQNVFDEVIKVHRADLAEVMKNATKMELY